MKLITETEKLIIREFILEDAENLRRLHEDKEVTKYIDSKGYIDIETTTKTLQEKILENAYKKYGYGRWAVHLKANGLFIGWCGLEFLESENEADLGFRFQKRFWNKGFATEAAKACIDFGFNELKLTKIIARVIPENTASIQVLKKLKVKEYKQGTCEEHAALFYELKK